MIVFLHQAIQGARILPADVNDRAAPRKHAASLDMDET
jgi:hypothetical protein